MKTIILPVMLTIIIANKVFATELINKPKIGADIKITKTYDTIEITSSSEISNDELASIIFQEFPQSLSYPPCSIDYEYDCNGDDCQYKIRYICN